MVIGYFGLIIVLTIVPIILGYFWSYKSDCMTGFLVKLTYSYSMGLFFMLAVFEAVILFVSLMDYTFKTAVFLYSFVLLGIIIIIVIKIKKYNLINAEEIGLYRIKLSVYELTFLLVFIVLLLYQLYYAFFFSRTYMADDGYVAFSSAAYETNYINLTDLHTGIYNTHDYIWLQRVIQAFNYFPAYLAYISGVNSSIIAHTVLYVFIVFWAYMVYYIIANQLFKKLDEQMIFLSFICLLYIWGYHSHYSLAFRLLGPNDSGKAVLAVVFTPFCLTVLYEVIKNGYRRDKGIQLSVLSASACAFSLGGVYTFFAVLASIVIISFINNRNPKILLYLLWGGIIPIIIVAYYLSYK